MFAMNVSPHVQGWRRKSIARPSNKHYEERYGSYRHCRTSMIDAMATLHAYDQRRGESFAPMNRLELHCQPTSSLHTVSLDTRQCLEPASLPLDADANDSDDRYH